MKASAAIIGGGIQGLMLAFCLAERGMRDIVVVDAGYWQGGASGRNGTLVRPGFSSPEAASWHGGGAPPGPENRGLDFFARQMKLPPGNRRPAARIIPAN